MMRKTTTCAVQRNSSAVLKTRSTKSS